MKVSQVLLSVFALSSSAVFAGESLKPSGKVDFRLQPGGGNPNAVGARNASDAQRLAALKAKWGRVMAPAQNPNRVQALVDVDVADDTLAAIRATGATVLHSSERWKSVTVEATPSQIDALGKTAAVRSVSLSFKPWRRAGPVTTQGDEDLRANSVRALGITGGGQTVGVLSDTVNRTAAVGSGTLTPSGSIQILTGTTPQNMGELPAQILVVDPGTPSAGDSDEGEAMLEIVHDLAPGATLAFATASGGQAVFADNIRKLRTLAGCTVITDDIQYLAEPMFQDGPIAQAIAENFTAGVPHFAAAGNNGADGVQAAYVDINPNAAENTQVFPPPTRADFHNWGIGTVTPELLPISVPNNSSVTVVLQWNQPFQSFGLGAGAQQDLDLYLFDPAKNYDIAGSSFSSQGAPSQPSGDPVEIGFLENTTGATQTYYIGVDRFNGVNADFRLVIFASGTISFPNGGGGGPSLYGHAASLQCVAVGAVPHFNAAATGPVGAPEPFSSKGGIGANGLPFYFSTNGTPAFSQRNKPDIAAIDGVNTSVFQFDDASDADAFPNFYGTSAAAPHAAAVAALVKSRATLTPTQVLQLMQASARDVSVAPAIAGVDDRTGAGLIDALAAVQALVSITQDPQSQTVNEGQTASFSVTATGQNLQYQWRKNGQTIPGANASSYTTPATVFLSDNNARFTCVVSNLFSSQTSGEATLTVLSAPQILTPPVDSIVNIGQTATFFVVAVGSGSIQYQWKRDGQDINGAVAPTLNVPNAQAGDDRAEFVCVLTNTIGSTNTTPVRLIINTAPTISSQPVLNPNPAMTGQTVSCTVGVSDAQPQTLLVTWNFGDGSTGNGASTTHVYQTEGVFNGTVRVTDPLGLFAETSFTITTILDTDRDLIPDIEDSDDDNDGVSDVLELEVGTSPTDKTSTPFGNKVATSISNLPTTKLALKLSFKAPLKDSLSLSGTVPIPANYQPFNDRVTVSVGGVAQAFDLDAKGKSLKIPQGSFKVTFKARKGVVEAQIGKYALKLSKLTFNEKLADENLLNVTTPVKKEARTVTITLFFAQQVLQQTKTVFYTAKTGSGSAK